MFQHKNQFGFLTFLFIFLSLSPNSFLFLPLPQVLILSTKCIYFDHIIFFFYPMCCVVSPSISSPVSRYIFFFTYLLYWSFFFPPPLLYALSLLVPLILFFPSTSFHISPTRLASSHFLFLSFSTSTPLILYTNDPLYYLVKKSVHSDKGSVSLV